MDARFPASSRTLARLPREPSCGLLVMNFSVPRCGLDPICLVEPLKLLSITMCDPCMPQVLKPCWNSQRLIDIKGLAKANELHAQHCKEAVRKLENAVRMIEEQAFKEEDYHAKYNFIKLSIRLGEALAMLGRYPDAFYVVGKAYRVAKALKDTKTMKLSKKLILKAAEAVSACGYLNNNVNNHISAERFYK